MTDTVVVIQEGPAEAVDVVERGPSGPAWPSAGVQQASEAARDTAQLAAQTALEAQQGAETAEAASKVARDSASGHRLNAQLAQEAAQQALDEVRAIAANPTLAAISTDPDNRLTTGSDDGLFVPELAADPLAYYILAKT